MAHKYLSTVYTLANVMANVRGILGIESEDPGPSGVFEPLLIDMIHDAISDVRSLLGAAVDDVYMTDTTSIAEVGLTNNRALYDFSVFSIADVRGIVLYDDTINRKVPIVSTRRFEALRDLYLTFSIASFNTARLARITNIAVGGTNKLSIEVLYGASYIASNTLIVSYPRNPVKQLDPTGYIDAPDHFVPLIQDLVALRSAAKVGKDQVRIPDDLKPRVQSFMAQLQAKYGDITGG